MKKVFLPLLFILLPFIGKAQTVIENPYYEVSTTGVNHITKIELSKKETKVTLLTKFIPNWWISISDSVCLEIPETGEKLYARHLEGTEFNKKTYMPASGDSTFILTFPPIPKNVKRINYHDSPQEIIYGLSLDRKQPKRLQRNRLPKEIEVWFEKEIAEAQIKEPLSLHDMQSEAFFNETPARLVGYLKGYDTRLGFKTGIIYLNNEIIHKRFPVVISIEPNGRFEANLNMAHPGYKSMQINGQWISFYIEPGQTLAMVLDWEEFLLADRHRDKKYVFNKIEFRGSLAQTNTDLMLADYAIPMPNPYFVYNEGMKMAPDAFEKELRNQYKTYHEDWGKYLAGRKIDAKAQAVKEINMDYEFASRMFEYSMRKDEHNSNFPLTFYNFLQELPLNSQLSLISENHYNTVLNRFEYMPIFRQGIHCAQYKTAPAKTLKEFFVEKGKELSNRENVFLDLMYNILLTSHIDGNTMAVIESNLKEWNAFFEDNKKLHEEYYKTHIAPLELYLISEKYLREEEHRLAILKDSLRLPYSFTYEITKMRSLKVELESMQENKKEAERFIKAFNRRLTTPYFRSISSRLFAETFPEVEKIAYELPQDDKGAEIFRRIINKHRGKILFVDFWATTCGPCIAGIKQNQATREKYKDDPDFDFIFITDDRPNETVNFNNFVKEHALFHSYSVTKDEMNYLMQLFKFSGIPHYIKVDKKGKILDDNYNMYNLDAEIEKIKKQK
ncbi:TlpA disulfide reductase family protein [Bacteroides sp. 224]|uniref:TlpA family protein disulfide reductase n=1 Tax=Bacteroides sp. 224 TaxID=2302936 RepID=UPI0013D49B0B|nr:TlpA disulfide reductase family protein [Bacteroides sp. 224]